MTSRSGQRRDRTDASRRARLAIEAAQQRAMARRRSRNRVFAAVAAAAVVLTVAIATSSGGGSPTAVNGAGVADEAFSAKLFAGIHQRGLILGSPSAPVRIVEYADLQCPHCGAYAAQALPQLVTDYVRPGKVSMEFRNLSFIGPDSVRAGRVAAAAAEQNKLWNFVDLMYLNQGRENTGYVTHTYLRQLLAAVPGLDVASAESVSGTPAADAALGAATAAAAAGGINATPSFMIGPMHGQLRLFQPSNLSAAPFVAELGSLLGRTGWIVMASRRRMSGKRVKSRH